VLACAAPRRRGLALGAKHRRRGLHVMNLRALREALNAVASPGAPA